MGGDLVMQILVQIALFALVGALVRGTCRLLRLKPILIGIAQPRRSCIFLTACSSEA